MIDKYGTAQWKGDLKSGKGHVSTESGALNDAPYGFNTRFEDQPGSNPEELVGAAHAGWKGALAGVTDAAVEAMEALGADRAHIAAAVGPCIAQASYEVDTAFLQRFCEDAPENERFFADGADGHHQFDLEGYVAARLAAAGVTRVACLGLDTYRLEDRYFSYRRATHREEPDYGRQISLIGLAAR